MIRGSIPGPSSGRSSSRAIRSRECFLSLVLFLASQIGCASGARIDDGRHPPHDEQKGVFLVFPDRAVIVRDFWTRRFIELTRGGFYEAFFLDFHEHLARFAQTFPEDTRRKWILLDSLERSFQNFCAGLGVEREYFSFRKRQELLLEN